MCVYVRGYAHIPMFSESDVKPLPAHLLNPASPVGLGHFQAYLWRVSLRALHLQNKTLTTPPGFDKFQPAPLTSHSENLHPLTASKDAGRGIHVCQLHHFISQQCPKPAMSKDLNWKESCPKYQVMTSCQSWLHLPTVHSPCREGVVRGMASMYTGMCSAKQHAQAWRRGMWLG